ncbi:Smr/MutS family protein [Ahrensia sp. 13_GOM-1096m]|uniref:Smr/MutS family protein n=1 Tax=Ahrensia sp. 13_GOM-1096m TaxID=1380380 RepID=UPI00047EF665|nr:Smr/MutS family protein [Ahrensia sp. 13_GOM-1096m]
MTRKINVGTRELKPDEKVLWNLVTRTVVPMRKSAKPELGEPESFSEHMDQFMPAPKRSTPIKDAELRRAKAASQIKPITPEQKPKTAPSPAPIAAHIDKPVYRKIAKGRLPIDSQVDLHDLTQDQAIHRLQAFLTQARNLGQRHVLVITGKGGSPTSEGVLRRMLPIWLNMPAFSSIVNGYQAASRGHGGDGAFYVRLRRLR